MAYQGWKNYPTWNVALWIDNDQGLYEYVREMKMQATSKGEYAEMIKEFYTATPDDGGMMPELSGPAADLLGYAFDQVDWYEIADSLWEED